MPAPEPRRRTAVVAVAVLLVVFAVYRDSKVNVSYDSLWTLHEAWSLVREGDLDLDEYRAVIPADDYRVEEVRGRLRSTFPAGTALLVAPLAAMVDAGARALGNDPYARLRTVPPDHPTTKLAKTLASVLVALAAAVLVPLGTRPRSGVPGAGAGGLTGAVAAGLALAFAFATPAWSILSRGLWQHGPVVLCLAAALLLLVRGEERAWATAASALPLAFAYVVRPTAAIPLVAFGAAVAVRWPRRVPGWLAAAGAVLVPFALWSRAVYGAWLPPYHLPGRLGFHDAYLEALAANLVSPARGLLVHAPLVAFAGWGLWLVRGRLTRREGALEAAAAAACVVHWLVVSAFPHWWAGHGYGPRFMTDLLPLLVWLAMPAVGVLAAPAVDGARAGARAKSARAASGARAAKFARTAKSVGARRSRRAGGSARRDPRRRPALWTGRTLLAAAVAWGVFVNARGARDVGPWGWHETPVDLDRAPSRVWDWSDPPFLRTEERP